MLLHVKVIFSLKLIDTRANFNYPCHVFCSIHTYDIYYIYIAWFLIILKSRNG